MLVAFVFALFKALSAVVCASFAFLLTSFTAPTKLALFVVSKVLRSPTLAPALVAALYASFTASTRLFLPLTSNLVISPMLVLILPISLLILLISVVFVSTFVLSVSSLPSTTETFVSV